MKNLHKKIIAGALIGVISMGGFLAQGVQAFADSFDDEINQPVYVSEEENKWSHQYLKKVGERFGFRVEYFSNNKGDISVDGYWRNPGDFVQRLYDKGKKKGSSGYHWIAGSYYKISFYEDINRVPYWDQWENDKYPVERFYSYFYNRCN